MGNTSLDSTETEIFDNQECFNLKDEKFDTSEVLQTNKIRCSICNVGELKEDGKPTKMVVYGRNGANIIPH